MVARISNNYFLQDVADASSNHRALDRTFVLELVDPKDKSKVDARLLEGSNSLHAVRDPQLPLWRLKFEKGMLPDALKTSFTSFTAAKKFVESYYIKRGVKVTEVID